MSRIVYVNGQYLPEGEARVSIFDRGFLMADAVYEVTSVLGGKLIDFAGHCTRLRRSLGELDMASPCSDDELLAIHRELVARNAVVDGMIYLQVTRGNPGDRDFAFPDASVTPTLVLFTQSKPGLAESPAGAPESYYGMIVTRVALRAKPIAASSRATSTMRGLSLFFTDRNTLPEPGSGRRVPAPIWLFT